MRIAQVTTDNREPNRDYNNPAPRFGTAPQALLEGFALLPDIEVHVISCTQQPMESPRKLAENIWFHSLHVARIGWMRTGYQGCVRAIRRRAQELEPDIVHGQGTERECALAAAFSGYPNVVTIHGNMAELARVFRARRFSFNNLAAHLENFTLPRTAGVFCNSAYTESLVRGRAKRTWRVANAVRAEFFEPPVAKRSTDLPIILNVGDISTRKRQLEILEMASRLCQNGHRFRIQFIGQCRDTPYGNAFRRAMGVAEEKGFAQYLGVKSTDQIIRCFDRANALLHFPTEEAFGLVVVEALARGLAFFGADIGGVGEIARGKKGATLVRPDSWLDLEQELSKWFQGQWRLSDNDSDEIERAYHPRVIAAQHLQIYRELLAASV